MKPRLLRAFIMQMGPLEASESIDTVNNLMAGTGHMDKDDFRNYMAELGRKANANKARVAHRPKSMSEMMTLGRGGGG